jgi:chromosome segregation ATPase
MQNNQLIFKKHIYTLSRLCLNIPPNLIHEELECIYGNDAHSLDEVKSWIADYRRKNITLNSIDIESNTNTLVRIPVTDSRRIQLKSNDELVVRLEEENNQLKQQINDYKVEFNDFCMKTKKVVDELEQKNQIKQEVLDIDSIEQEKIDLNKQIEHFRNKSSSLEDELKDVICKNALLRVENHEALTKIHWLENEILKLENEITEQMHQFKSEFLDRISIMENESSKQSELINNQVTKLNNLTKNLLELKILNENLNNENEILKNTNQNLIKSEETLKEENSSLTTKLKELIFHIDSYNQLIEQAKNEFILINERFEQFKMSITQLHHESTFLKLKNQMLANQLMESNLN